jgi:hypothetical protein
MGAPLLMVDREGVLEAGDLEPIDPAGSESLTAVDADVGIGLAAAGDAADSEDDFPLAVVVIIAVLIVAAVAAFLVGFRSTRRKAETLEHDDRSGPDGGRSPGHV